MTAKFDVDGFGSNVRPEESSTSATTHTSARKFFAKDQVENVELSDDDLSNAEHLIDQAAGLKTMAVVAEQAATIARANLRAARDDITFGRQEKFDVDARPQTSTFTENDVEVSQKNMARQISETLTTDDQSNSLRVTALASEIVFHSTQGFIPTKEVKNSLGVEFNTTVPEIESITLDLDRKKGVVDAFFARIVFNLPWKQVQENKVKAIRVFRSEEVNRAVLDNQKRLSLHALDALSSGGARSRAKDGSAVIAMERRLSEDGVNNSLSSLLPVDDITGLRGGSSTAEMNLKVPIPTTVNSLATQKNMVDLASFVQPELLKNLDKSVANDLKSLKNIQVQNPSLVSGYVTSDVNVGKNVIIDADRISAEQLRQLKSQHGATTSLSTDKGAAFKEIAFFAPDKLRQESVVGNDVSYVFVDPTVTFGRTYKYYFVTVNGNFYESLRSKIVSIDVDGMRVPECPKRVQSVLIDGYVALGITVDDLLVEKFEVWRKEYIPSQSRASSKEARVVSGKSGFSFSREVKTLQANNFMLIGESINGGKGGSMYYDRRVIPGRKYTYRVYSVDIFGNKSECPNEFDFYIPEKQFKALSLKKPTLTAEIDSKTYKTKLIFECDDPRIEAFFLERRDLTLNQKVFAPPGQPSILKWGHAHPSQGSNRFQDVKLNDKNAGSAWPGYFRNNFVPESFTDLQTEFDHTYQYRICGVDRFGNKTSYDVSRPVFVSRRPFVEAPVNLVAQLVFDSENSVQGVKLNWQNASLDVSAESKLGDQEELRNNSIKTLYQVERRKVGEERWSEFPLIERTDFFDSSAGELNRSRVPFRPDFLEMNERYVYRIEAVQSGGLVSNFSDPVEIFVGYPVLPPTNFRIKIPDTRIRPFYLMLNWGTDEKSGIVDRWEIERAAVNNFAAARFNVRNPTELDNLNWTPFRTVYRESSRFSSETSDVKTNRRKTTIVGEHRFMDNSVNLGNTYFYRIRSVAVDGVTSDWVLRGAKVTDEIFEKKQAVLLSDAEKSKLTQFYEPLNVKSDFFSPLVPVKKSDSLQPYFSSPVKNPSLNKAESEKGVVENNVREDDRNQLVKKMENE